MSEKTAIIIGGGPAGLTAAYELASRTDIRPVVLEKDRILGGISRTVNHHGNRIDIGGHRFFSKSDRVMNWWLNIMPVEDERRPESEASEDGVMLVRSRKSRIYFLGHLFDYPISLSVQTLRKLGLFRAMKIVLSFLKSSIRPLPEKSLEDFFINRFGRELYLTFFKSYTEKVWGIPCEQISAEWGAQRVKGLSIAKALSHFIKGIFSRGEDVAQKGTETSLIERFYYPKYGPGQMWERVAEEIERAGGEILTGIRVDRLITGGDYVVSVEAVDEISGEGRTFSGEYFFSTMPVRELIHSIDREVPNDVKEIGDGLLYRDFITVGLLLSRFDVEGYGEGGLVTDNWIYMQEPGVEMGRIQIFNNWSPHLVADPDKVWVGLEYFCFETDDIWTSSDEEMVELATGEIVELGFAGREDVLDATVIRMPKTYPAYFGTYSRFDELREYVDVFKNLYLIGRNGMHRYNNQDHSMLTAMIAVDNILEGREDKSNIWAVNTEQEYHESA